jgi:hypothetical protein
LTNLKQKEYNAAYRRREAAYGCIRKLKKLIEESSNKDAEILFWKINEVLWKASNKSKIFGEEHISSDKKGNEDDKVFERNEDDEQIEAMDRKFGCFAVEHYFCPVCRKTGYQFSPNLDAEGQDLERYILHIGWPLEESTYCHIPPAKKRLFLFSRLPTEGVFTISKLNVHRSDEK